MFTSDNNQLMMSHDLVTNHGLKITEGL